MFSNHFSLSACVIIQMCQFAQVLTSSLSNYLHIFIAISNVGSLFEGVVNGSAAV